MPQQDTSAATQLPDPNKSRAVADAAEQQGTGPADAAEQASTAQQSQNNPDTPEALKLPQNANPLRSLGSAQEQWRRDFKVIQDATDQSEQAGAAADDAPPAGDQYEFAPGEDDTAQEQLLASATQDQAEQQTEAGAILQEEEASLQEPAGSPESDHAGCDVPREEARRPGPAQGSLAENKSVRHTEEEPGEAEALGNVDNSATAAKDPDAHGFVSVHVPLEESAAMEMVVAAHGENSPEAAVLDGGHEAIARGYELLQRCTAATAQLTGELVEQLRLVIEPTVASRLSGEYKTGKRLNMKKVIAYIASNFRRDKIWMRRTSPDKRDYQVLLAIDETKSMKVSTKCTTPLPYMLLLT